MVKEFEVKAPLKIEDGKHEGIIKKIEYRGEETGDKYEYTDIYIEEIETGLVLKVGVPTYLSPNSKFGKLLSSFLGRELKPKERIVPEQLLIEKEVEFLTTTEKTDKGEFSRILVETLKPKVKIEKIKDMEDEDNTDEKKNG